MNNLLFLALILTISVIIYFYYCGNNLESLTGKIDEDQKKRVELYKKVKMKLEGVTCGLDDRCDYLVQNREKVLLMDNDGNYKIQNQNKYDLTPEGNIKIGKKNPNDFSIEEQPLRESFVEGITGSPTGETTIEKQIKYCKAEENGKAVRTCEDLGSTCGYCDDDISPYNQGRFMWTNKGAKGSGLDDGAYTQIGADRKPCPPDKWVYGDVEKCKKLKSQRLCGLIKDCEDFEKYEKLGVKEKCGYCPPKNKGIPVNIIKDEKNKVISRFPIYDEDNCFGDVKNTKGVTTSSFSKELQKMGSIGPGEKCTNFKKNNPCITKNYWKGIPDHTPDCYADIFKKVAGKKLNSGEGLLPDDKKNTDWWSNNENRKNFNVLRDDIQKTSDGKVPVPNVRKHFENIAGHIENNCFKNANKSWNFFTGLDLDPCVHQNSKGGNRDCQRKAESEITEMTQSGLISDYINKYDDTCGPYVHQKNITDNIQTQGPIVDSFGNMREGNTNLVTDPRVKDEEEAEKWFKEMKEKAPKKFKEGGTQYANFLMEIEKTMYGGKTYALKKKATELLKGKGVSPPPPPPKKVGDYVEYRFSNVVLRGTVYKVKQFSTTEKKCLVMWDYYKSGNNRGIFRGPSVGSCFNEQPGVFSEGSCIEGVYALSDEICDNKKDETKKKSCKRAKEKQILDIASQRKYFGYPQYPYIKSTNNIYGADKDGWIDMGLLRIKKRCKKSSEGCTVTDFNCEENIYKLNSLYKAPQDCKLEFGKWSDCSTPCAIEGVPGKKSRRIKVIQANRGNGISCRSKGWTGKGGTLFSGDSSIEINNCNFDKCADYNKRVVRMNWCPSGDPNCNVRRDETGRWNYNKPVEFDAERKSNCIPVSRIRRMANTRRDRDYKLWVKRCKRLRTPEKCISKTEWPRGSGGRCEQVDSIQVEAKRENFTTLKQLSKNAIGDHLGGGFEFIRHSGRNKEKNYTRYKIKYLPGEKQIGNGPLPLKKFGVSAQNVPSSRGSRKLLECEGDCDRDRDCGKTKDGYQMKCFQRSTNRDAMELRSVSSTRGWISGRYKEWWGRRLPLQIRTSDMNKLKNECLRRRWCIGAWGPYRGRYYFVYGWGRRILRKRRGYKVYRLYRKRDWHNERGKWIRLSNVPGCKKGGSGDSPTWDYCYDPRKDNRLTMRSGSGPRRWKSRPWSNNGIKGGTRDKLGLCEGDCDSNTDCMKGLVCMQRNGYENVPGCVGKGVRGADYCVDPVALKKGKWKASHRTHDKQYDNYCLVGNDTKLEIKNAGTGYSRDNKNIVGASPTGKEKEEKEGGRLGLCSSKNSCWDVKDKDGKNNGLMQLKNVSCEGLQNMKNKKKEDDSIFGYFKSFINFLTGSEEKKKCIEEFSLNKFFGSEKVSFNKSVKDFLNEREKGSNLAISCDMGSSREKRVGIFKCIENGRENKQEFPFKTKFPACADIDGLKEIGYRNDNLICEIGCEGKRNGKCTAVNSQKFMYNVLKASGPYSSRTISNFRNGRKHIFWNNEKSLISNVNTGDKIRTSGSRWPGFETAKEINQNVDTIKIEYYGRDQGRGNRTLGPILYVWTRARGRRPLHFWIGNNCSSRINRKWSKHTCIINLTQRMKKTVFVNKMCFLLNQTAWGHKAYVRNPRITLNEANKFKVRDTNYTLVSNGFCEPKGRKHNAIIARPFPERSGIRSVLNNEGTLAEKEKRCANSCGSLNRSHMGMINTNLEIIGHNLNGVCVCHDVDYSGCKKFNKWSDVKSGGGLKKEKIVNTLKGLRYYTLQ